MTKVKPCPLKELLVTNMFHSVYYEINQYNFHTNTSKKKKPQSIFHSPTNIGFPLKNSTQKLVRNIVHSRWQIMIKKKTNIDIRITNTNYTGDDHISHINNRRKVLFLLGFIFWKTPKKLIWLILKGSCRKGICAN